MRVAAWLAATAVALALAAVVAPGRESVATPDNLPTSSISLGPVVGSVTQTIDFPPSAIETVTIWTRSEGPGAALGEAHVLQSGDGPPLRSAVFEAPLGAEVQPTQIPFAPLDLLAGGTLVLRIVAPEPDAAALYVGGTRNDAYPDGQLVDRLGHAPVGIDLAFATTGHAGALARLRTQASEAPVYLGIGIVVALLAGAAAGRLAWSTLDRARFRQLAAGAVGAGIAVATILGPLLGPVRFP